MNRIRAIILSLSLLLFLLLIGLIDVVNGFNNNNNNNSSNNNHNNKCHRVFPQKGIWEDEPPYWNPNNCPKNKIFDQKAIQECMKGRTLYVIGNSVPRQMAFGLIELLGGANTKREGQKDLCPKHETFWGDSCHQEFAGVKIRYLYLQFMDGFHYAERGGFPFLNQISSFKTLPENPNDALNVSGIPSSEFFYAEDNCINHHTRECIAKFFKDATANDVLMFQLGGSYALSHIDTIDLESWLLSSAASFKGHLAASFPGTVFRFTGSQLRRYLAKYTPAVRKVDELLWNIWRPGSEDENSMWYTIDQWAINEGRDHLYNDHIHYSGKLTHATLFQVLNMICPQFGIDRDFMEAHANRIIYTGAYDHYNIYFADNGGYLHKFLETVNFIVDPNKKAEAYGNGLDGDKTMTAGRASSNTCLDLFLNMKIPNHHTDITNASSATPNFKHLEVIYDLPQADFQKFYKSDAPDADIHATTCTDHVIVKGTSRTVYLIENYQKRTFMSLHAFASRGFDFANLVPMHDWMLQLIPDGPNLE